MKKSISIILILLSLILVSCAKKEDKSKSLSKYFKIEGLINTGFKYQGIETTLPFAIYKNFVFINPVITKEGLKILEYDFQTKKSFSKLYLLDSSFAKTINQSYPQDIDASEKNIIIIYSNYLLIVDRINSKNSKLINVFQKYSNLKICNNELYIYRMYQIIKKNQKSTLISKFSLDSNKIIKTIEIPFDATEFTYYAPANFLSISPSGQIASTYTLKPRHFVYNNNLELEQELYYLPKNWKDIDLTNLYIMRKNYKDPQPSTIFGYLNKCDDGVGCRLISILFPNDTTILASYLGPTVNDKSSFIRYCNIWKKRNGKWVIADKELKDGFPEPDETLTEDNFPFLASLHNVKFFNDKAYYIEIAPNQKRMLQFGKKYKDVRKNLDEFFALETVYYQLYIFKCRF